MTPILCTFPGKYGDLLWALPTLRALARRTNEAIDLLLPETMVSIKPLLTCQPYIGKVYTDPSWTVLDTAPASPRIPPSTIGIGTHLIIHLGYKGWPKRSLAYETMDTCNQEGWGTTFGSNWALQDKELDLQTPWLYVPEPRMSWTFPWVYGFTDEHFELKYGVVDLLLRNRRMSKVGGMMPVRIGNDPRWNEEAGCVPNTWLESAQLLVGAGALLTCNSALHVLGVATGVPVVMMEPNPHRHHFIFYPVGDTGPQVHLVRGNDGQPTFDARHVRDVLSNVLAARRGLGVDSAPPRR